MFKISIFLLLNFYFVYCVLDEGDTCSHVANSPIDNGLPGICMKYQECTKVKELWEKKLLRKNQVTRCNIAKRIICCPREEERISEKKCKEYGKALNSVVRLTPMLGQRPTEINVNKCAHKSVSLIFGGEVAKNHEFPHQALLGFSPRNKIVNWICGGSLVSPRFVLTAAHCLYKQRYGHVKKVKLGMNRRDQNHDNRKVFVLNVKETFKHPNYNEQTFNEDIALLKLNGIVPIDKHVLPICMPTKEHDNYKALATGFGATKTQTQSDALLKVVLERFDHSDCKEAWPEDGIVQIDEETMLCFGHHTQRKDTCRGDSGGPLQISNDENVSCTYTQIGISSFGPERCGTVSIPSAYTNVFNYIDWIEEIVWGDEA
ncbi:venom protease-like [Chironomus tepperi]|uniref:venom protease-like n=1 Tax=Chironomus tepperi TaxID=113505 RepID=UPI00391F6CC0